MVSLLIISIGLLGFGMAIPAGKGSVDKMKEQRTALFLAKQMMEEIQSKAYEDPDLPTGSFGQEENYPPRSNLDDVDDYDGINESPPEYPDGTILNGENGVPNYQGFHRHVDVENVDNSNYNTTVANGTTDSKRVTVTVSSTNDPKSFDNVVLIWVATREGMQLMY
jgi:hypothetical protein